MIKTLIACVFFTLLSNLASAANQHDNEICFMNGKINSVKFLGHSITQLQPFDSSIGISKDNRCLIISAGRKNTTKPVDWVHNGLTKDGIEWNVAGNAYHTASGGLSPDGLNFAIKVNLNITIGNSTYTCNNLYLAQGHYNNLNNINNWWIFSNNNKKNYTITCNISDSDSVDLTVQMFSQINGQYNQFTLN